MKFQVFLACPPSVTRVTEVRSATSFTRVDPLPLCEHRDQALGVRYLKTKG